MRPREVLAGRGCRPLQVGHAAGVGLARALAEQGEGVLASAAGGPSGEEGSWAGFSFSFSFLFSNHTQTI